ncbi:MAG: PD40 domain-containing protein [Polyangiaceae bacterium]|nr:PD40 domain-containing protein [Polyangiaceae bacterium]
MRGIFVGAVPNGPSAAWWTAALGLAWFGFGWTAVGCGDRGVVIATERMPGADAGGAAPNGAVAAGRSGPGGRGGAGGESEGGAWATRPSFAAPRLVTELSDPEAKDQDPSLTEDLLEIFFFSDRSGDEQIWTSRRPSADAPWEPPTEVVELGSDTREQNPAVSRDGLRLWFYSRRDPPGIWFTERAARADPWDAPSPVSELSAVAGVIAPSVDASELRLAVSIGEAETHDLYEALRDSREAPWGELTLIAGVNGDTADSTPFLIGDGMELLFSSSRSGAGDLFWGRRDTLDAPVDRVEPLTELNQSDTYESHPHLSVDRRTVYFGSDRSGGTDIYEASR